MSPVSGTSLFRPESLTARIRWLLLARVFIVTIFLGVTAVTQARIDSDPGFPLRQVVALIIAAYAISLGSVAALGRVRNLRGFAFAQVVIDVLLISLAIPLTGGMRSPMAVWYNLAIIAAALLFFRRGAFVTATLSSLLYGTLMNLAYWEALPAMFLYAARPEPGFGVVFQIAANLGSFYSIAFLGSILVERLASTELALERSEASRQRIETLQNALVQHLESGVITTGVDGRIESANQAVRSILGCDPGSLIGRSIVDVLPVLRNPVGSKRVLDPNPIPTELQYSSVADGSERTLRCTGAVLTDTYQRPIGSLYILQDVTVLAATTDPEEAHRNGNSPAYTLPEGESPHLEGLIGKSKAIRDVFELIGRVAHTDSTVLITGESGTGKELAARAVHTLSRRRNKPMVVVNCAAIPENLIESELFGHVRGAFTGAIADRRGLFRAADGGTIFLDEIGDLPLGLQVKLLRVLQERAFTPVGAQAQVAVDVRVMAATNRELETEVDAGRFREDLFYRLNVIRIEMPPLRDRREDLPVLIRHFLERFSESLRKASLSVSEGAMERLLSYPYPGNIRELENVIEHATALCGPVGITEEDLPAKLINGRVSPPVSVSSHPAPETPASALDVMQARGSNLDEEIEEFERRFLEEALQRANGVRKRAAEILGINYRSLRHRLAKYGFGELPPRSLSD